jgi:hypothetical protein
MAARSLSCSAAATISLALAEIDQDDERHFEGEFGTGLGRIVFEKAIMAAAGGDDGAFIEQHVAQIAGCFQEAAAIVAEVEDQAVDLLLRLAVRAECGAELVGRALAEIIEDADVADTGMIGETIDPFAVFPASIAQDRFEWDRRTCELVIDGLLAAGVEHAELDASAFLAADHSNCLAERHIFGFLAVDGDDSIARADAGHVGRLADQRLGDVQAAILRVVIDNDADADEFTFELLLELIELVGTGVAGVGIELADHAVHRAFEEDARFDIADVVFRDDVHRVGQRGCVAIAAGPLVAQPGGDGDEEQDC